MKTAKNILSLIVGLMFLFFGVNYFLHFVNAGGASSGPAKAFMDVIYPTGYLTIVKIFEISSAILILIPRTRALGLILLAPIVVNIVIYELLLAHAPGLGVLGLILDAICIALHYEKYLPIIKK